MTNEEIIKYVMKTPNNTNPSILNNMLNSLSRSNAVEDILKIVVDVDYTILSAPENLYEKISNLIAQKAFIEIVFCTYDIDGDPVVRFVNDFSQEDHSFYMYLDGGYGFEIRDDGTMYYSDLG